MKLETLFLPLLLFAFGVLVGLVAVIDHQLDAEIAAEVA